MRMISKLVELKLGIAYRRRSANLRPDNAALELEPSPEKYEVWERCSLTTSRHICHYLL